MIHFLPNCILYATALYNVLWYKVRYYISTVFSGLSTNIVSISIYMWDVQNIRDTTVTFTLFWKASLVVLVVLVDRVILCLTGAVKYHTECCVHSGVCGYWWWWIVCYYNSVYQLLFRLSCWSVWPIRDVKRIDIVVERCSTHYNEEKNKPSLVRDKSLL